MKRTIDGSRHRLPGGIPAALRLALAALAALSCGVPGASTAAGVTGSANDPGGVPGQAAAMDLPPDAFNLPAYGKAVVLACGDALLTRRPGRTIEKAGYQAPFAALAGKIEAADLAFVNLECPASFIGTHYPGKPDNVTFRASPGVVFSLKRAGFDVVSLANNHMNDYGPDALRETLDYFDLAGLARCGAGVNAADARKPAVIERNGLRIAFLAYAEPMWSVIAAGESSPGVAHAIVSDMKADVRQAAAVADHVFVSVHWGDEHQRIPRGFQTEFGRAAIDSGASVVLGHHPHVLQSVERHGNGIIIYSMGNFVFDMEADSTYQSALFRIFLEGRRVDRLEIEPVTIQRGSCVPRVATPEEAAATLAGLASWSKRFGTTVLVEGSVGLVSVSTP
ncbi:MAG: CapA family protein [Spirochaetes bacterium]|nr:CapA family protein [Spirochaetota bacterium]